MTVESARVLMVNTVRNFLNYANSFPNIKEFLNESTLNVKNLNFGIIYPCWMDIPSEIKCVCLVLGKISYSIKEHEDGPFVDIHKESFEEAERIVAEQNLNR